MENLVERSGRGQGRRRKKRDGEGKRKRRVEVEVNGGKHWVIASRDTIRNQNGLLFIRLTRARAARGTVWQIKPESGGASRVSECRDSQSPLLTQPRCRHLSLSPVPIELEPEITLELELKQSSSFLHTTQHNNTLYLHHRATVTEMLSRPPSDRIPVTR